MEKSKLLDELEGVLSEDDGPPKIKLGANHQAFMVLPSDKTFSCANCKFHGRDQGGAHTCGSTGYQRFSGTNKLVDPHTKQPLDDESVKHACSDWFEVRTDE